MLPWISKLKPSMNPGPPMKHHNLKPTWPKHQPKAKPNRTPLSPTFLDSLYIIGFHRIDLKNYVFFNLAIINCIMECRPDNFNILMYKNMNVATSKKPRPRLSPRARSTYGREREIFIENTLHLNDFTMYFPLNFM